MRAHLLLKEPGHLMDAEFDATHLPFPEQSGFRANMISERRFPVPDRIVCSANLHLIPGLDYPIVDVAELVCSDRMLEVLDGCGMVEHRCVPVLMVDDTELGDPLGPDGAPRPDVRHVDGYQAVQLLESPVTFDPARSIVQRVGGDDGFIAFMQHIVLAEPAGGFPAMFRLAACPPYLFVSDAAKRALEAAGITGCVFEPVEVI